MLENNNLVNLVNKIEQMSVKPRVEHIEGVSYLIKSDGSFEIISKNKHINKPEVLLGTTLDSIVDYLKSDVDLLTKENIIIKVDSQKVTVISGLIGEMYERATYFKAVYDCFNFDFKYWIEREKFQIQLQSQFGETEDKRKVLALISNLAGGEITESVDDGITQKVSTKRGITKTGVENVPNPVILKPLITFSEVKQPERICILRLRYSNGDYECALYEADGGKWKVDAINNIKKYLRGKLEGYTIIG